MHLSSNNDHYVSVPLPILVQTTSKPTRVTSVLERESVNHLAKETSSKHANGCRLFVASQYPHVLAISTFGGLSDNPAATRSLETNFGELVHIVEVEILSGHGA